MLEEARFGKIGNWLSSLEKIRDSPGNGAASLYYHEWAERPVILSEGFYSENVPESVKFSDGPMLIQDVMRELDSMFLHEFGELNHEYLAEDGFRRHMLDKFKDPGVLHHFIFWDFVKDPTAVTFEWHRYHGEGQQCIDMLHGQYYDIFGRPCLANAVSGPWEHLVRLYYDQIQHPHRDEYGKKLFSEVLGWPLS